MSKSDDKSKESSSSEDKELNELLDSALDDFGKSSGAPKNPNEVTTKPGEGEEIWDEQFIAEQAKLLEERMNSIFGGGAGNAPQPDQISVGLQKMAEAAAMALQGGDAAIGSTDNEYADSIKEALKGIKDGVSNIQSPISSSDVANMFSGLNLGEGEETEAGNPFLPFMQGMMQSLLSAEILLPSMKELLEKYPKYLEDNKDKISAEDRERYIKQQELFEIICKELESEKEDDSAEVKQERFKKVLDNMQKLHEYGQPPEDLVGEVGGTGLPSFGDPTAMASGGQCPLM